MPETIRKPSTRCTGEAWDRSSTHSKQCGRLTTNENKRCWQHQPEETR